MISLCSLLVTKKKQHKGNALYLIPMRTKTNKPMFTQVQVKNASKLILGNSYLKIQQAPCSRYRGNIFTLYPSLQLVLLKDFIKWMHLMYS